MWTNTNLTFSRFQCHSSSWIFECPSVVSTTYITITHKPNINKMEEFTYTWERERERESNPKNSTFSSLAIHVCHAHTSDSILYFFVYIFIFSLLSAYTTTTIPYHTIPYHSQPPPHAQHNHHMHNTTTTAQNPTTTSTKTQKRHAINLSQPDNHHCLACIYWHKLKLSYKI